MILEQAYKHYVVQIFSKKDTHAHVHSCLTFDKGPGTSPLSVEIQVLQGCNTYPTPLVECNSKILGNFNLSWQHWRPRQRVCLLRAGGRMSVPAFFPEQNSSNRTFKWRTKNSELLWCDVQLFVNFIFPLVSLCICFSC